jgi:HEAT repeat protein
MVFSGSHGGHLPRIRWREKGLSGDDAGMRRNVSRPVLLTSLAGAVLVLVAGGFAFWNPLVERWMVHRVESGDDAGRAAAIEWLRRRGTARAVPALIDDLERRLAAEVKEAESSGRQAMSQIFEEFGRLQRFPPAAALAAIMDRVPGDCARVLARDTTPRHTPYLALHSLGARADAAVPELVRKLEGADGSAWDWVPWVLASIGPAARPALPLILRRIESGEPGNVAMARCAGSIATGADVPALLALLESTQLCVRRAALWALERMGPRAAPAVPELEKCLRDADEEVRTMAILALGSIREEPGSTPARRGRE